jgi:hypothetical protein
MATKLVIMASPIVRLIQRLVRAGKAVAECRGQSAGAVQGAKAGWGVPTA